MVLFAGCALILFGFFADDPAGKEASLTQPSSIKGSLATVPADVETATMEAAETDLAMAESAAWGPGVGVPRAAVDQAIDNIFEKDFDEGFDDLTLTPPPSEEYISPENLPEMIPEPPPDDNGGSSSASGQDHAGGYLIWPVRATLTSSFGPRGRGYHHGIDLGASYGAEFQAAAEGVVTFSGWYYNYGRTLIIRHPNGWQTLYAHASQLLAGEGERVSKGQVIGKVGSSGRSTGSHLHFELIRNGNKVNPLPYLPR